MSRIANYPVPVPPKVDITLGSGEIVVKGPLGSLTQKFGGDVEIQRDGDQLLCRARNGGTQADAMSGTLRALVANMVKGVTDGFEKKLTLVGVGYRAQAQGDKLNLTVGYSHPVVMAMPAGITVATPTPTEVLIKGADRQRVGQIAAEVRAVRPPEPYKGKGIRYADEKVTIKETKKK